MIKALIIKVIFRMFSPFLNLKIRKNTRYASINITGNKAGQAFKLSIKFPFNISIKALCVTQPGHSIPKSF